MLAILNVKFLLATLPHMCLGIVDLLGKNISIIPDYPRLITSLT